MQVVISVSNLAKDNRLFGKNSIERIVGFDYGHQSGHTTSLPNNDFMNKKIRSEENLHQGYKSNSDGSNQNNEFVSSENNAIRTQSKDVRFRRLLETNEGAIMTKIFKTSLTKLSEDKPSNYSLENSSLIEKPIIPNLDGMVSSSEKPETIQEKSVIDQRSPSNEKKNLPSRELQYKVSIERIIPPKVKKTKLKVQPIGKIRIIRSKKKENPLLEHLNAFADELKRLEHKKVVDSLINEHDFLTRNLGEYCKPFPSKIPNSEYCFNPQTPRIGKGEPLQFDSITSIEDCGLLGTQPLKAFFDTLKDNKSLASIASSINEWCKDPKNATNCRAWLHKLVTLSTSQENIADISKYQAFAAKYGDDRFNLGFPIPPALPEDHRIAIMLELEEIVRRVKTMLFLGDNEMFLGIVNNNCYIRKINDWTNKAEVVFLQRKVYKPAGMLWEEEPEPLRPSLKPFNFNFCTSLVFQMELMERLALKVWNLRNLCLYVPNKFENYLYLSTPTDMIIDPRGGLCKKSECKPSHVHYLVSPMAAKEQMNSLNMKLQVHIDMYYHSSEHPFTSFDHMIPQLGQEIALLNEVPVCSEETIKSSYIDLINVYKKLFTKDPKCASTLASLIAPPDSQPTDEAPYKIWRDNRDSIWKNLLSKNLIQAYADDLNRLKKASPPDFADSIFSDFKGITDKIIANNFQSNANLTGQESITNRQSYAQQLLGYRSQFQFYLPFWDILNSVYPKTDEETTVNDIQMSVAVTEVSVQQEEMTNSVTKSTVSNQGNRPKKNRKKGKHRQLLSKSSSNIIDGQGSLIFDTGFSDVFGDIHENLNEANSIQSSLGTNGNSGFFHGNHSESSKNSSRVQNYKNTSEMRLKRNKDQTLDIKGLVGEKSNRISQSTFEQSGISTVSKSHSTLNKNSISI